MAPLTSRPPAHRRFHETLVPVRRRFASPRSAVGGRPLALRRRTHTTVRKPICDARGVRTLCPRDRRPEYRSLPIRGCRRERPRQKAPSERPGETARCVRSRHRSTLPRSATAEKADRALSRSQTGGRDGDVPKGRGTPDHPTRFVAPPHCAVRAQPARISSAKYAAPSSAARGFVETHTSVSSIISAKRPLSVNPRMKLPF